MRDGDMAAIFGIPEIKARKLLGITQIISFWFAYIRIFFAHDMSSERDTFLAGSSFLVLAARCLITKLFFFYESHKKQVCK